jgi:DNA mismatch repair protein MutS2
VDEVRDAVRRTRQVLERETVTAPALDAAVEAAEEALGRLPVVEELPREAPPARRSWRVGERARSRSGGWEGRIASIDRRGRRATLETAGMRVSVTLDDLEAAGPAEPSRETPSTAGGTTALQLGRARAIAASLDLRGARVEEALEALTRYLDDASLAGLDRVTIVHGLGTGALRDAVRAEAASSPLVRSLRPGERGEGGDGATIVEL